MPERIRPSGIRAVFERALELERQGRSIVHLEIGRPNFDSPPAAKQAAIDALTAGVVHYTSNRGTLELREAISVDRDRRNGLRYDPASEVIVTAGGSEAVAATIIALLGAGDEAIVLDPAWPHYDAMVRLAGATPVHVPCLAADAFLPDPVRVAAAITPRTRLLIVSSPSNPTGAVLGTGSLQELAEISRRHDLVVLSDEIYERFTYGGHEHRSIATLPEMRERTVIANSFSKSYSMTGWRVGYAAAARPIADRVNVIHQYLTVCAPSFGQAGAVAALEAGENHVEQMVRDYDQRRQELVGALSGLGPVALDDPAGAFYAFPAIDAGDGDGRLALRLLEEAGVAVVPGNVFGEGFDRHVRISYAVSAAELDEGLARLAAFLG